MNRQAGKRDDNEPDIVAALRAVGATVYRLSPDLDDGVPDLLVGFRGQTHLIEVKAMRGRLTPAQKKLHQSWKGASIAIVHDPAAALDVIGAVVLPRGKQHG